MSSLIRETHVVEAIVDHLRGQAKLATIDAHGALTDTATRVAGRFTQLAEAVEGGLFDQLDECEADSAEQDRQIAADDLAALDRIDAEDAGVSEALILAMPGAHLIDSDENDVAGELPDEDQSATPARGHGQDDGNGEHFARFASIAALITRALPDVRFASSNISNHGPRPVVALQLGLRGEAESRALLHTLAERFRFTYAEIPFATHTRIEAGGEVNGVRVEIWDHAKPAPVLVQVDRDRHALPPIGGGKLPRCGAAGVTVLFASDVTCVACLALMAEQARAAGEPEYFDQAEADDVREIRREKDIEAGDDSEALRQEADDYRIAENRRHAEDTVDVRALHTPIAYLAEMICDHCEGLWPCLAISALDVAEDFATPSTTPPPEIAP